MAYVLRLFSPSKSDMYLQRLQRRISVRTTSRLLRVHPSGFHAFLKGAEADNLASSHHSDAAFNVAAFISLSPILV
ncbi:MAG: hypothetical protein CML23_08650 [Rhizobiaceae bacterium]|nr:hypothetical protein [Rhizobiaceae bacterium]